MSDEKRPVGVIRVKAWGARCAACHKKYLDQCGDERIVCESLDSLLDCLDAEGWEVHRGRLYCSRCAPAPERVRPSVDVKVDLQPVPPEVMRSAGFIPTGFWTRVWKRICGEKGRR